MIKEITYHALSSEINEYLSLLPYKTEDLLFFDIETTGFNRSTDQITSITFLSFEKESNTKAILFSLVSSPTYNMKVTQLFCQSLNDELSLLKDSKEMFEKYRYFITYNGHSFDIPFLNSKYQYYNIFLYFNKCMSLDLYLISKRVLNLESYKLKNVETALGIIRTDQISGYDCTKLYFDYLITKNPEIPKLILKHNIEDVINMVSLLKIFKMKENYFNHNIEILDIPTHKSEFICYLKNCKVIQDFIELELYTNMVLPRMYTDVNGISISQKNDFTYQVSLQIQKYKSYEIEIIGLTESVFLNSLNISFSDSVLIYNHDWIRVNISFILETILKNFSY